MALERICDICGKKLGTDPKKYWSITITEYGKRHANMYFIDGYGNLETSTIDSCEDCANKIKREISFLMRKETKNEQ